jgi:4-amino-4-deoxy-L-arabinose transferase-like glycosyltransferase
MRVASGQVAPPGELHPETMRTPGYPGLLAVLPARSAWLMSLTNVVLSVGTVAATFFLGALVLGRPRAGLVAAGLLAVQPGDATAASYVLTETPFAFLLVTGLLLAGLAARSTGRARWPLAAWAGLVLSAGAFVRPVGLVAPVLAAGWVLLHRPIRRTWAVAALLLGVAVLPVAGWCARNAALGYGPSFTSVSAVHLAKTATLMRFQQAGKTKYPEEFFPFYDAVMAETQQHVDAGATADAGTAAVFRAEVRTHPRAYGRLMADSAAKFWTDHSMGALLQLWGRTYRPTGLRDALLGGGRSEVTWTASLVCALAWMAWNALMLLAAVGGLVRLALRRRWRTLLLLVAVVGYFLAATQYHGLERMRVPVMGLQMIAVATLLVPPKRAPVRQTAAE